MTKKVIIAPDSFKESLTALEVADAIEEGFKQVFPEWEYVKIPMGDGGEGTLQSLIDATGGIIKSTQALDPLGREIKAEFGVSKNRAQAVIEMATASGLELVENSERDVMQATSWGLGDLIKAALDEEVEEIIVGIGGSATNDGGAGMIQSLGGKLLDEEGQQIPRGGAGLSELASIDLTELDERLNNVKFIVASDVNNPFVGENGASYIYGAQKGASKTQLEKLDQNLQHFADVIKRDLNKDIAHTPGVGAAGGAGGAFLAFLEADLRKGGDVIVEELELDKHLQDADLVLTGEGGINHQTVNGKTPIVVAKVAKKYQLPVIAIAGSLSDDFESVYDEGIDAVFSILQEVVELETALDQGYENIVDTARNIAAILKVK